MSIDTITVSGTNYDIHAASADSATTATKLGTSTVGSSTKPIYLSSGTATASTTTVGSTTQPVYLKSGTITAMSGALSTTYGGTGTTTGHIAITQSNKSTSSVQPGNGGSFTCIDSITTDDYGHVTKINVKTVTLPTSGSDTPTYEGITIEATGMSGGGLSLYIYCTSTEEAEEVITKLSLFQPITGTAITAISKGDYDYWGDISVIGISDNFLESNMGTASDDIAVGDTVKVSYTINVTTISKA